MDDASFWTRFRQASKLSGCELEARVNFDRLDAGIRAVNSEGSGFRLLSISPNENGEGWPAKLVDSYTRGNDMVTTYAGADAWPFASQIYWSFESEDATALSLLVSIQTDRLDTHPRVFVRSLVPTDELLLLTVAGDSLVVDSHVEGVVCVDPGVTACCAVWRLPGAELSYAEIMLTSDFRQLAFHRKGSSSSQWELFSEFLEKGVIRRARLHALFVPRADDVQRLAEYCQAICKSPLPLTT